MNKAETAVKRFKEGFNCAQAVFSAFAEDEGISKKTALKIGAAFGAGMARTGETCGAVTGALMVIGLRHSSELSGNTAAKEKTRALAQEFMRQFKSSHGSLRCKDLLGIDVSTPEGWHKGMDQGLFVNWCPKFVRSAVEIVKKIA